MKPQFTRFLMLFLAFATLSTPAFSTTLPPLVVTEPDSATLKSALHDFTNLSKKERNHRFKEVKRAIKNYKKAKKAGEEVSTNTLLLVILAILLPPLAVYLHEGEINNRFWISLALTLLAVILSFSLSFFFWLLAVLYALIVVLG